MKSLSQKTEAHFKTWKNAVCRSELLASWRYLQKADKMSMAHSLEVRVPFLDKEVFNFAAKLPKEAKIAAGTTKYIFRKAVSEFLPQETNERKKLGFPIPIRVWLRQNDWYQMVTDLFTSKEAEEFSIQRNCSSF